ncbi:BgTH12-01186 [Blumeria graminis f. sp. triticale]|uniref:Bgt-1213 n=3 Tax=Blumeria graminis TaxID=34373 RepID=A0A061HFR2_BLUGR|nr:Ferro-O2-oxidoreductase [Blumeria graminis f. sp. tritici 96224]CAD6505696.1 BgTH12-01186 [Blumeria graminis f. sp. triticale]VDB93858.1 Bgt-1213 [Blumeria graminis f. sp. tritici]
MSLLLLVLLSSIISIQAETQVYNFNITWVRANPDGAFERPTIGINNKWPPPIIQTVKGDQVIVNVENQLGNQTTTLHFHGLHHNGTANMDGAAQVTQCGIAPGARFTYNFTANQAGTYWYHSHDKGQYPDGLRAPFIITDPESPYQADEEVILSVSDWYHEEMTTIIPRFLEKTNPTGAEPVPQAALINDTQNLMISIQPEKTYLFHLINMGAFAGQYIWFEGHNMTVVEVDGVATIPVEVNRLYISAGQRYSFLLRTKAESSTNYAFVASMDTDLFDILPDNLIWNSTGYLVYDKEKPIPQPATVQTLDFFDDLNLIPLDKMPLLPPPDKSIVLDVIMGNLENGRSYSFFNNITYTHPKVPTLYTLMSSGSLATDSRIYGQFTHSYIIDRMQTIEIVINNLDDGKHPFHLHGHNFQTLVRSGDGSGKFDPTSVTQAEYPTIPMRRDTVLLHPHGHMVIRFRADNPGVWMFHCHIEWHMAQGLSATLIEAPLDVQKQLTISENHFDNCRHRGIPIAGNAAANTVDLLNLDGANVAPGPLPAGFTDRGIVAMSFSCLAAILGLIVISWYGLADMGEVSMHEDQSPCVGEEGT